VRYTTIFCRFTINFFYLKVGSQKFFILKKCTGNSCESVQGYSSNYLMSSPGYRYRIKVIIFLIFINSINSPGPKMKFAVEKAVFHKKFYFWTRAINQIQNFYKKKISSNSIKNYFGRGYSSNNSMSSPGHSRKSCRYVLPQKFYCYTTNLLSSCRIKVLNLLFTN
jgi:hypothetical protein